MKAPARASKKPLSGFESLNPFLRKILLQVRHGSEPALEELCDYVEENRTQDNLEGHTAITQVIIERMEVETTEKGLKELLRFLFLASEKMDEDMQDIFLGESPVLLGAIERYLRVASLLEPEHIDDAEYPWNSLLSPILCIDRFISCILHLGSRTSQKDPARIPSSNVLVSAIRITTQLWLLYSRESHLVTITHLNAFSVICKTLSALTNDIGPVPDVRRDMYAAILPLLYTEDVVSLCVAHLERRYQSRDKVKAPQITLGALFILQILHDYHPSQQTRMYEDVHLAPALSGVLKRTLLSFPRSHCQIDRTHNTVAARVCDLLVDVVFNNPLKAIRVPQALNYGLWSACRRLVLIGACACNAHGSKGTYNTISATICPWTRMLEERDKDRRSLISFSVLFSRYLVDSLLCGRAATYRQLEKAMRRSAYEEAKLLGDLKQDMRTRVEWERNRLLLCQLLEKRRQYGECLREDLCDRDDCNIIVYPKDLQICSGCFSSYYCSRACQKIDWKAYHCSECASNTTDSCKYSLEKTILDYDFLDWLYEDSPELQQAGYGLIADSDSDSDSDEDPVHSDGEDTTHADRPTKCHGSELRSVVRDRVELDELD